MSVVVCVCVRDVRVAVALGAEQRHDSSLSELIPSLMGGQPQALPTMPGA